MLSAAHAVHFLGLLLHAAEEVAAADHHADFDAQGVHFGDFAGNFGHLVGIQAEAARAGQRLARKLENDPFIHAFSSIA